MDIYKRIDLGMITPQGDDANYWGVRNMSVDLLTGDVHAEIYFWEKEEKALLKVSPNCIRNMNWTLGAGTDVTDGIAHILALENFITEDGIILDFINSTKIN